MRGHRIDSQSQSRIIDAKPSQISALGSFKNHMAGTLCTKDTIYVSGTGIRDVARLHLTYTSESLTLLIIYLEHFVFAT